MEPFDVKSKTSNKVVFIKEAALTNYLGFTFEMGIQREVAILPNLEIQKLVNLLDGEIWEDSQLGKGSSFFLAFPLINIKKDITIDGCSDFNTVSNKMSS